MAEKFCSMARKHCIILSKRIKENSRRSKNPAELNTARNSPLDMIVQLFK
jgi:hypothetical protein